MTILHFKREELFACLYIEDDLSSMLGVTIGKITTKLTESNTELTISFHTKEQKTFELVVNHFSRHSRMKLPVNNKTWLLGDSHYLIHDLDFGPVVRIEFQNCEQVRLTNLVFFDNKSYVAFTFPWYYS